MSRDVHQRTSERSANKSLRWRRSFWDYVQEKWQRRPAPFSLVTSGRQKVAEEIARNLG